MTIQQLASQLVTQDFRLVGETIIGVYKGFPFTLTLLSRRNKESLTMSFALNNPLPAKTIKEIRTNLPKGSAVSRHPGMNLTAVVTCPIVDGVSAYSLVNQMLDASVNGFYASKKQLVPPQNCPICAKAGCDSLAIMGASFVPVHRECVVKRNQKTIKKAQHNDENGNYALGILGALLGAIVGCLPTILLIFIMQYEFGLLYMLIPMASYQGYKLFRGRLGNVARASAIICSVLAFIAIQPTIYHIVRLQMGYKYDFLYNFAHYFSTLSIGELLADSWFGLLFFVFGLVSAFKMLGATNSEAVRDASVNLESLTNRDGSYTPVMGYEMQRAESENI